MNLQQKIYRRDFIKISTFSGAALFALGVLDGRGNSKRIQNVSAHLDSAARMNAYIIIDLSGKVTIYNHRPEMGQGTFEAIPMIIAEELEVDINQVTILPSPANRKIYGDQMVVGSRSIASNFDLMRRMGASAKEMLIAAAANAWKVPIDDCYAQEATVIHRPSGRKQTYGELSTEAAKLQPTQNPKLKNYKDFHTIGLPIARRDIPGITCGQTVFGLDCAVPGTLYASIERSPVFLGRLLSFDDSQTRMVQGVRNVLRTQRTVWGHTRDGVAVLADTYWAALQGRKRLIVKWDNGGLDAWSTKTIQEDYEKAAEQSGEVFEEKGNFQNAFDSAAIKMEYSYELPYQAHVPMEPMNALVHASKDSCEYWGSTQNPNGFRSQLAKQCGIPEEQVIVHYTAMGGAFGRRSLTDVAEEAADLSIKTGSPVQVVWTREDDLTQGPFRACSLNVCKGALDAQGNLVALEHKVICQEINNQIGDENRATRAIAGGINTEYAIPNLSLKGVLRKFYIPISYWRSVYHSTNCFAHESFIDELADRAKKDPLDFRLSLLKQHERYTMVLQKAAEMSNWYRLPEKNSGRGVAIVERSGAFVAVVAEVAKTPTATKVIRINVAIDCGIVVNPDTVKAQTEGCVVMGLTAAYKGGLTIDKGQVVEQNFHDYNLLRINECPEINVEVMRNKYPPTGAGEAGLPAVAPALTNAIFNMTGKRIRALPFNLALV